MVSWSSLDNNWGNDWSSMDGVSNDWGSVDGMGNWVGNNWGMDGVGSVHNWSSMDSVDWGMDGVSNNWGSVHSVGNWGMHSVGNSWSYMWGKVTSRDNSTSMADDGMVSHIRGGESGSKAEEGRDNKSLK